MNFLNYQGNKNRLKQFISQNTESLIQKDKPILDIFCGGGAVSSFFCEKYQVFANDLEPYSYYMSTAFLLKNTYSSFDEAFSVSFINHLNDNTNIISKKMKVFLDREKEILKLKKSEELEAFYKNVPTLWNHFYSPILEDEVTEETIKKRKHIYCLFTLLYSASYFGVLQAIEIDSIRYAIEKTENKYNKPFLYACLFHAMNCAVLSKDGHMAQPLSISQNLTRTLKCRRASVREIFFETLEKYSELPVAIRKDNLTFNKDFLDLLKEEKIENVGLIYADPPYTDMQYSRYYHLLNTACEYVFKAPTIIRGKYSKGLYLQNRRQSEISAKGTFLDSMNTLFVFCSNHHINLAVSFGYPSSSSGEKNNRYLASINELMALAVRSFGEARVTLRGQEYDHSNQRNSRKKKVVEYLILCRGI